MAPTGKVFYIDSTGQIYHLEWTTTNGVIDLTSTVMQPFVWGKPDEGYVYNNVVYRKGIITVTRQAIIVTANGSEIIAEGAVQYVDFIQTTFPGVVQPADNFKYHLNNEVQAEIEILITDGSHWSTIDETDPPIWPELDSGGLALSGTGVEHLEWIDVWTA